LLDPEELGDALAIDVAQRRRGQQTRLAPSGFERHGPQQRAAEIRPLPRHRVLSAVPGAVVHRAQEQRRVRIGDVIERRWLVAGRELADALRYARKRATTRRW